MDVESLENFLTKLKLAIETFPKLIYINLSGMNFGKYIKAI